LAIKGPKIDRDIPVTPPALHVALHPERVLEVSECQMSSMMPVLDVTGAGSKDPEYASSSTTVCEQSFVMQPTTVSLS
jgi:hypothetical protein